MSLDVDALLSELTLAEKASLTSGSSFWYTAPVERLGIPRIMVSDGPHGLRAQPGEGDHVGLGGSLPATCFPTASAVASAWNPDLVRRIGEALAQEARACNLSVILGPGINMKRSPLCGRNFEYFSEDPYLAGELGVGIVDGIQSRGVGTSVKHYAANNQETDRLRVDAQVDERTLREFYLPAFERIVTACQPWTIMCSYNKVNGLSALPLTADSTLHEWMADPLGLALIQEAVAAGRPDPTRDAELVSVIGTMPMSTLAAFQGLSVDHDTVDKLVERLHAR
jgi:beta-glucosidase